MWFAVVAVTFCPQSELNLSIEYVWYSMYNSISVSYCPNPVYCLFSTFLQPNLSIHSYLFVGGTVFISAELLLRGRAAGGEEEEKRREESIK